MGLGGLLQIRERITAAADLSANQYHFVQIDGTLAGDGEMAFPLVDKPSAAGQIGTVVLVGKEKVVAGGTISAGDKVGSDLNGEAIVAATADEVLGVALEAAVAGDVFTILVNPMGIL